MTRRRRAAATIALIGSLAACQDAEAATSCGVSSTALTFGGYLSTTARPTDMTATVTVSCLTLVGVFVMWTVALSAGASGSYMQRYMTAGTSHLNYQIYTDSGHSQPWGDGTGGSSVNSGSYTALAIGTGGGTYTAYGRITALQWVSPGMYGDTIIVTLTYQ